MQHSEDSEEDLGMPGLANGLRNESQANLRRLSVYVQCKRPQTDRQEDYNFRGPSKSFQPATNGIGDSQVNDEIAPWNSFAGNSQFNDDTAPWSSFTRENTVIILESSDVHCGRKPLVNRNPDWHNLLDHFSTPHSKGLANDRSTPFELAKAVVNLSFENIAKTWSDYISKMHARISSLEDEVYERPADDSRANELWSISKQLLRMENLLKFQTMLMERVQSNICSLAEPDVGQEQDWLRHTLVEFQRISSQVQELLTKPTSHMVDLVR